MNSRHPDSSGVIPLTNGLIAVLAEAKRLSGPAYALIPLLRTDAGREPVPMNPLQAICLTAALTVPRSLPH